MPFGLNLPVDAGLLFVVAVCCAGALVSGAIGFGFPLLAMPLLTMLHDTRTAIVISMPITCLMVAWLSFTGPGLGATLRHYWYMPVAVAAGNVLAGGLLRDVSSHWLQIALGIMIVCYLGFERLPVQRWQCPQGWQAGIGAVVGLAAGLSEAAVNVSVVPLLLYARWLRLERDDLVRFLNVCFIAGRLAQFATYWGSPLDHGFAWQTGMIVLLPSFALMLVGVRLRRRLNPVQYLLGIKALLLVMAAGLMIHALAT